MIEQLIQEKKEIERKIEILQDKRVTDAIEKHPDLTINIYLLDPPRVVLRDTYLNNHFDKFDYLPSFETFRETLVYADNDGFWGETTVDLLEEPDLKIKLHLSYYASWYEEERELLKEMGRLRKEVTVRDVLTCEV